VSAPTHTPVLVKEVIEALAVQPGGRYIDCTLGSGGHAAAIMSHSLPGGQLLGIDADPNAIKTAGARLEAYKDSILLVNENSVNLQAICIKYDFRPVHGILFDLGLSSLQLNGDNRGFSFKRNAPLDMRLNPTQKVTAADIIGAPYTNYPSTNPGDRARHRRQKRQNPPRHQDLPGTTNSG
jgi:16S rRNA (cytosine1402-N4)-methyltransferase